MEVIIQNTIEGYYKFFRYYSFKRDLYRKLFIILLITLVCTYPNKSFVLQDYLEKIAINLIILSTIFFLVPYIITIILFKKNRLYDKVLLGTTKITKTDLGIRIESSDCNELWQWDEIKLVENSKDYIYISLLKRKSALVISKSHFNTEDDANKFYKIINNEVLKSNAVNNIKDGSHLYRFGLLGFIPNFGVIAGIILLFKGIFTYQNKKLVAIGIADILFTFIFWFSITHTMGYKKSNTDSLKIMADSELNSLVKDIEFYKMQHGNYPDSIEQATEGNKVAFIKDPFLSFSMKKAVKNEDVSFHYQKIRDKYTLFSVGVDKTPNTPDDIFPTVTKGDTIKFGFIKE